MAGRLEVQFELIGNGQENLEKVFKGFAKLKGAAYDWGKAVKFSTEQATKSFLWYEKAVARGSKAQSDLNRQLAIFRATNFNPQVRMSGAASSGPFAGFGSIPMTGGSGLATSPSSMGPAYSGPVPPVIRDLQRQQMRSILMGAGTALFNPWIGARLLSDATKQSTGGKGVAGGIFGKGGAMGFAEFYVAIKAINFALKSFEKAVRMTADEIRKAFSYSHQLFGKSLSGGMSLGFTANRQMTADALGVPESEVFRFKQSSMLMKQLSGAVGDISKNAPQLAYTVTQFKVLQYNVLAVASDIGVKLTPALNGLALTLDLLVAAVNKFHIPQFLMGGAEGALKAIFGHSMVGDYFEAVLKSYSGKLLSGTLGAPQTFMRQMQTGQFEKMGLVVGSGGKAIEYARQTAYNTGKLLEIHARNSGSQLGGSIPRGYTSVFNPISNMP